MTERNHRDSDGPAGSAPRSGQSVSPSAIYGPSERSSAASAEHSPALQHQRIALVDLLDRVLAGGVVISGDVRLSIADVDLVHISLRALIASARSALEHGSSEEAS